MTTTKDPTITPETGRGNRDNLIERKVREELGHMITYKVKATTTSWVQVPTRAGKKLSGHRGYI